jgi:hypothetical protein
MNLPNYFLADLPPEASLTPAMLVEACQTLKRNREQYLRDRTTHSLVRTIADLARSWLQPDYRFRKLTLAGDPEELGFPVTTLATGLDALFRELTPEKIEGVLTQDLGHSERLHEFCATPPEERGRRAAIARGPEFLVHVAAGNVPSATLISMVFGLLVRSAQFVKCASGAALVPRLFAHSLYELEPKLGACLELAEWPGGRLDLEQAVFDEADCVTATGGDEALDTIRRRVPLYARFIGYGHRVSFGYITSDAFSNYSPERIAEDAGADVVAWNQLGCLSPHVFYVERRSRIMPEEFAEMLAATLSRFEESHPRGRLPDPVAGSIASRRAFYEVRSAHSPDTRQWVSPASTAWTVVYEADSRFQASCLNRFIYVKPVADVNEALQAADVVRGQVSTVGVAAPEKRARELAMALARWGVTRVCPLGQMQKPPLAWRHDGRPPLADLVTWTDWES